jgi:hypothetical protein
MAEQDHAAEYSAARLAQYDARIESLKVELAEAQEKRKAYAPKKSAPAAKKD